ncbi:MAG: hypothetical protein ACK5LE_04500 [Alphaproteobacteria bacterium]
MKIDRPSYKKYIRADTTIGTSLYETGQKVGIPPPIISKLIRELSAVVDFEKDIKPGNQLGLLYQCEFDQETNERLTCNNILYGYVIANGEKRAVYSIIHNDGKTRYYEDGKNSPDIQDDVAQRKDEIDTIYNSLSSNR